MKESILVLGLTLAFLLSSGSDVLAQTSKEITEPVTSVWHSESKVLSLGEDSSFSTFEVFGTLMSDQGKGLFHEATVHSAGSSLNVKGVVKKYILYGCYLLKNGDRVFIEMTRDEYKLGTPYKGKVTLIGGTGKCAGIQGSWEYTGIILRQAAGGEGIGQGYNKHLVKYTLP